MKTIPGNLPDILLNDIRYGMAARMKETRMNINFCHKATQKFLPVTAPLHLFEF